MSTLVINKGRFLSELSDLDRLNDLDAIRGRLTHIRQALISFGRDDLGLLNVSPEGEAIRLDRKALLDHLDQMVSSRTLERTMYYAERLKKGLDTIKTSPINDINLNRWKEYTEIFTDSLWVLDKRDKSAGHAAWYWGNYIPQIPQQLMARYTKAGEWVLDPFAGSGTTLIEGLRMGRNVLGVDINSNTVRTARNHILTASSELGLDLPGRRMGEMRQPILQYDIGDSTRFDFQSRLHELGTSSVQLLLLHPPYHDIIKFGDDHRDLSRQESLRDFVQLFEEVLDNTLLLLDKGRYIGLVIGDKYSAGEWIPLGFRLMQSIQNKGCTLRSIVVKNFEETTGKRNQKELWRYRALVGGFYVFKHEYIMILKKR